MRALKRLTTFATVLTLAACGSQANNSQLLDDETATDEQLVEEKQRTLSGESQQAPEGELPEFIVALQSASNTQIALAEGDDANAYDASNAGRAYDTPTAYTQAQLTRAFEYVRDNRPLTDLDRATTGFATRRLTWMYPDDGCFARATMMGKLIRDDLTLPQPKKIFSFGTGGRATLRVSTTNHSAGQVTWWYHVAPIVRVSGTDYVIDPAVNPSGPMTKAAWLAAQEHNGGAVGSSVVCDENAHSPSSKCIGSANKEAESKEDLEETYLGREWNRQVSLRPGQARNVLGNLPPWAN